MGSARMPDPARGGPLRKPGAAESARGARVRKTGRWQFVQVKRKLILRIVRTLVALPRSPRKQGACGSKPPLPTRSVRSTGGIAYLQVLVFMGVTKDPCALAPIAADQTYRRRGPQIARQRVSLWFSLPLHTLPTSPITCGGAHAPVGCSRTHAFTSGYSPDCCAIHSSSSRLFAQSMVNCLRVPQDDSIYRIAS